MCAGYPNVGKSSLINGLMGKKVSIFYIIVIVIAVFVMYQLMSGYVLGTCLSKNVRQTFVSSVGIE